MIVIVYKNAIINFFIAFFVHRNGPCETFYSSFLIAIMNDAIIKIIAYIYYKHFIAIY